MRDCLGSLAARVFALLCVGIVAAAALAFAASDLQSREAERLAREQRLVEHVGDLVDVLRRAPAALRPRLLGEGPEAARLAAVESTPGPEDTELTARLTGRLGAAARVHASPASPQACLGPERDRPPPPPPGPAPPPRSAPAPPPPPPPDCRRVTVTLARGERIGLIMPAGPHPPPAPATPFSPTLLGGVAAGAATLAAVTAQLATAPVRRLTAAAAALGLDLDRPPLAVGGPTEVRRGARAFNAMQAQLKRREAERTHMLAAITHDLQTPLTRMRLRMEAVGDPALRAALLADGAAMLDLIRAGLDLARAAAGGGGPLERLDLDSLLDSLCEDAVAAGAEVSVVERCGAVVPTRPEALRRCVGNLLENALKHAGAAELACRRRGGAVEVQVRDRGPGVPPDRLAEVLEPFVRLETSRSRETGGVGLGLTIARLMAGQAEGDLTLANRPGGGLSAVVRLRGG